MSKRRPERVSHYDGGADYPSLRGHLSRAREDHRLARRRFLAGGAALVGGGVLAACTRPFGVGEGGGEEQVPGDIAEPQYYTLRFPESGDASLWLIDGGYATYHVTAITWEQDCYHFALDGRAALQAAIAAAIDDFTYDELEGASRATMDSVRAAVKAALDAAYNEDTGDVGDQWFQDVEVVFTRLDAPQPLDGMAGPEPQYP
jgi:hypothetical protein